MLCLKLMVQYVIVGKALADKVCAHYEVETNMIVAEFSAREFVELDAMAQHPFIDEFTSTFHS